MFANDKNIDNLQQLFVELKKYAELQKDYVKLHLVEKLTILVSSLILVLVLVILGIIALFYLSFTLAYVLAPHVGGLMVSYGIITGCILSVGRITSESAALLFTAGFGLKMIGFVQALQSSSATLTVALYIYASERGAYDIAFAIAIVLMALTLALNLIASKAAKKIQEKRG